MEIAKIKQGLRYLFHIHDYQRVSDVKIKFVQSAFHENGIGWKIPSALFECSKCGKQKPKTL